MQPLSYKGIVRNVKDLLEFESTGKNVEHAKDLLDLELSCEGSFGTYFVNVYVMLSMEGFFFSSSLYFSLVFHLTNIIRLLCGPLQIRLCNAISVPLFCSARSQAALSIYAQFDGYHKI